MKRRHLWKTAVLASGLMMTFFLFQMPASAQTIVDTWDAVKAPPAPELKSVILDSKAIMVGVPTLNDMPYPSIGDLLYYLRGLHFNRTGERFALTFGSMGGKGGAVKILLKPRFL